MLFKIKNYEKMEIPFNKSNIIGNELDYIEYTLIVSTPN